MVTHTASVPSTGQLARTQSQVRTFGELVNEFLAIQSRTATKGTFVRYKSVIASLSRDLGEMACVCEITSDQLKAHFRQRAKQASAGAVGLEISVTKRLLSLACQKGWASTNAALALRGPRRQNQPVKTLTKAEFGMLWHGSPDWLRPMLALAISGLRRGEILALRSDDINVKDRSLIVRNRGSRERRVPLSDFALSVLKKLRRTDNPRSKSPLFGERQMTTGNVSQTFLRTIRAAGIDGISFDDLRYTGAQWLLSSGASLGTAAEFLGHADLRMIEKIATEAAATSLRTAISSIDESISTFIKGLD
jgi:integrase